MALFDTPHSMLVRAQAGDAGPLYEHLRWPLLMWYVSKGLRYDDAEDLASVLWVTVLRSITSVDSSLTFAPWFTTIALNKLKNWYRDQDRRWVYYLGDVPFAEETLDLMEVFPDPSPDPLDVLEAQEVADGLEAKYREMSPDYQAVLRLRVHGYKPTEIMDLMGWEGHKGKAERMTYKARKALRV